MPFGTHAGSQDLHRGRASAERPWSGCHPCAHGTSQEGFDAEWREIDLLTVEGDLINRCEIFDEADIDAALARFDELNRPARRLENAASQVERAWRYFDGRDWDGSDLGAADDLYEDRRGRA